MCTEGSKGGCGCSEMYSKEMYFPIGNVDNCKEFCKGYQFMAFHEDGFCPCYNTCDFERPAADFGSKADTYALGDCPAIDPMCIGIWIFQNLEKLNVLF